MFRSVLEVLGALSTVVIAVATICYVLLTRRLWKETRKVADGAKASADAAKESADLAKKSFEALHRPYLAISKMERVKPPLDPHWRVVFDVKNYGSLPAADTKVSVNIWVNQDTVYSELENQIGEIQPQAFIMHGFSWELDSENMRDMEASKKLLGVKIEIGYCGGERSRYLHTAYFRYNYPRRIFEARGSKTSLSP